MTATSTYPELVLPYFGFTSGLPPLSQSPGPPLAELTMPTSRHAPSVVSAASAPRRKVCVQGLGFVGAANAIAIASARGANGDPLYDVVGVELPNALGAERVAAVLKGRFPFATTDRTLVEAAEHAARAGNLSATTDPSAFSTADVIVVDVGLDLEEKDAQPRANLPPFLAAMRAVGDHMRTDALVLLESTVPPGTCERVVAPLLRECLAQRSLPIDRVNLAYCYERVMPGSDYLRSITEMWRVYAGLSPSAADAAEAFLSSFTDVERYPLRRLASMRAAEMSKVIENTYRAVNIALIGEWEQFARRLDVDLFEVLEAIRVRPTHQNVRYPGLGVGGYCLSKDPLFGSVSARDIYGFDDLRFPLSTTGVRINDAMPLVSAAELSSRLSGLAGKRILVLGASYRPDVADTRYSPTGVLARALTAEGAIVEAFDPHAAGSEELGMPIHGAMPNPDDWDAVVFAVAHREIADLDIAGWAKGARPLVFDANGVLSADRLQQLRDAGFPVGAIGRGVFD